MIKSNWIAKKYTTAIYPCCWKKTSKRKDKKLHTWKKITNICLIDDIK